MEIKLVPFGSHKLTSITKRPVKHIKAQTRQRAKIEGRKPAMAVEMGNASIPAPMQVPETSMDEPKNFLFFKTRYLFVTGLSIKRFFIKLIKVEVYR